MKKEDLLLLLDRKTEECYRLYRKILFKGKNTFNSLKKLDEFILQFTIKKIFFESLKLTKEEVETYYKEIDSINIEIEIHQK